LVVSTASRVVDTALQLHPRKATASSGIFG
jgi:hypothetical protein